MARPVAVLPRYARLARLRIGGVVSHSRASTLRARVQPRQDTNRLRAARQSADKNLSTQTPHANQRRIRSASRSGILFVVVASCVLLAGGKQEIERALHMQIPRDRRSISIGRMIRVHVAVAAIATHATVAYSADFSPAITVLSDDSVYTVNPDGSSIHEQTRSIRMETEQGVRSYGQVSYRYSRELQKFEVLEAYTTTRDGVRIDVPANAIFTRQSASSVHAPSFDDNLVKTIVFPGVEPGATVTMRTRETQVMPLFPGQFSADDTFPNNKPIRNASITINAPASMTLHADVVDMQGGQVAADVDGRQTWRWTIKDAPAQPFEANGPSIDDRSPRLAITTFPDYAALGQAYAARALAQATVTPDVQALADSVTKDIANRRDQTDALYQWVSRNIRYVAVFLGFGGVVPHTAQDVLHARYGDCKDHTTLLQALLAAKGIASSTVLVNADTRYWLPSAASPLAVFNHAITYVPEFDVYLDSTAGTARFGTLPFNEEGKQALLTGIGDAPSRLVVLPVAHSDADTVTVTTHTTLDPLGTVRGSSKVENRGEYDWSARSVFARMPASVEPLFAQAFLTATGSEGTGRYRHGDVDDLRTAFSFSGVFELPDYTPLPGPGAMRVPRGLGGFDTIASAFDGAGSARRKTPLLFKAGRFSEITKLQLPPSLKVLSLPKPVTVNSPLGTYTSSYAIEGSTVSVTRTLELNSPRPYLQPDEYPEFRSMARSIKHDLAAQIVYR
jgi:transglutaminase-like putative cysteine protease